jgi:hypothetical protein
MASPGPRASGPKPPSQSHPPVWPFPTYRGQPYKPPRRVKPVADLSKYEEALI